MYLEAYGLTVNLYSNVIMNLEKQMRLMKRAKVNDRMHRYRPVDTLKSSAIILYKNEDKEAFARRVG